MTLNLFNETVSNKPTYHHYPKKGLLNDPNGLIQWNGTYHMFYQLNPYDTTHKNKCWGHSTSKDMINWKRHPNALDPTDWFDKDGCYSGSSVVHEDCLYLFYTGNVINEQGERESYQCLAISLDGLTFEKKGPLIKSIEGYTAHVRDPKVWKDTDSTWKMVLGAQRENETGCLLLFTSNNLIKWDFLGELETGLNDFGYMWECPDLIINEEQDLLILSPQGLKPEGIKYQNIFQSGYILGKMKNQTVFERATDFEELDRGFEFYAPQTFRDEKNRLILYAWMGAMEPEVESSLPSISDGWAHLISLPRELKIKENKLYQVPVKELKNLRKKQVEADMTKEIELDELSFEFLITLKENLSDFSLSCCKDVMIEWLAKEKLLSISRTNWKTQKRENRSVILDSGLKNLQGYVDENSLEIFINQGEEVFSLRIYNEVIEPTINIVESQKSIDSIEVYTLNY